MPCRLIRLASKAYAAAPTAFLAIAFIFVARTSDAQVLPGRSPAQASQRAAVEGQTSREYRAAAIAALPMSRLTPAAKQRIGAVVDRPSLFRHLPTQSIDCDPELFLYIARHPEVLVGIWDVMGVTQVKTERIDEYRLKSTDGSGTSCTVDLVYGDRSTHVFVADGFYDGKLVANPLTGKGVFVLRTRFENRADGLTTIYGSLDCFLQLDQMGADLIVRTFGPLIGKTADHNFAETAKFIEQIGVTARTNPEGLQDLAMRLPQVNDTTRKGFIAVIQDVDRRNLARIETRASNRMAEREADQNVLPMPLR
jgi:hypothetical protein